MKSQNEKPKEIEVSIVLPCLNEEAAIRPCLDSIIQVVNESAISAEVIIVDNDSTDKSRTVVQEYKNSHPTFPLVLVEEKNRGYGSAYRKGLSIAGGKYVFMADLDGTYGFSDISRFISKLNEGYDLVIGNRFSNGDEYKKPTDSEKKHVSVLGSMPWHHRYIGNPFLSATVRLFFGVKIKDIHCGARAINRESLQKLSLNSSGMEFASEMVIKAARAHMRITEIPIEYNKRIGASKLRSFRDGWRHLRFIFLCSPLIIFLLPGLFLFIIGVVTMITLYSSTPSFLNITFYVHPMFFGAGCVIAGYQLVYFAFFAKTYAITHLGESSHFFERLFKYITLERACLFGLLLLAGSLALYASIFYGWVHSGFGALNEIKNSVVALTLLVIGVQTVSSAFMFSIIGIKEK